MTTDPAVNLQPVQALGPHTAPLGMRFYRWRNISGAFPREYDGTALIAEHGSWNRGVKIGYRIMMLRVDNRTNAVTDYEPFASGWLQNEGMSEHNFTWGEFVGHIILWG
jgi:glucose/arabinose dehydrogenase